jgi:hypothetical protein
MEAEPEPMRGQIPIRRGNSHGCLLPHVSALHWRLSKNPTIAGANSLRRLFESPEAAQGWHGSESTDGEEDDDDDDDDDDSQL